MLFVHAGVLLGESEELVDGYVVYNDENGIQASWGAMDGESDISEYFVGIGTAKGKHLSMQLYTCTNRITSATPVLSTLLL